MLDRPSGRPDGRLPEWPVAVVQDDLLISPPAAFFWGPRPCLVWSQPHIASLTEAHASFCSVRIACIVFHVPQIVAYIHPDWVSSPTIPSQDRRDYIKSAKRNISKVALHPRCPTPHRGRQYLRQWVGVLGPESITSLPSRLLPSPLAPLGHFRQETRSSQRQLFQLRPCWVAV